MSDIPAKYTRQAIDLGVLSVLDVTADGKVVSAQDWVELWTLVIRHINTIDEYCIDIEDIRVNWAESEKALLEVITEFREKYDVLSESFIHYGTEPPTNPHTQLWVVPTESVNDDSFVTREELVFKGNLSDKVSLTCDTPPGLYIVKNNTRLKVEAKHPSEDGFITVSLQCLRAMSVGVLIVESQAIDLYSVEHKFMFYGAAALTTTGFVAALKADPGCLFEARVITRHYKSPTGFTDYTDKVFEFKPAAMPPFGVYSYSDERGHILELDNDGTDAIEIWFGKYGDQVAHISAHHNAGEPSLHIACGSSEEFTVDMGFDSIALAVGNNRISIPKVSNWSERYNIEVQTDENVGLTLNGVDIATKEHLWAAGIIETFEDFMYIVRAGLASKYIKVGDQITVPHTQFGDLVFDVIGIGVDAAYTDYNSTTQNTVTIQLHEVLPSDMVYDAAEPNNPDEVRAQNGSNEWAVSGLAQWLRAPKSTPSNKWWQSQYDADTPPDYVNQAHFMYGFTDEFADCVKAPASETLPWSQAGAGLLGYTDIANARYPYYSIVANRKKYRNGVAQIWWTSSPSPNSTASVTRINAAGVASSNYARYKFGVSPVMVLA